MTLTEAPKKTNLEVISINNEQLSGDALRFGIEVGNNIEVVNNLPGGPIIIQKNQQQIAIGRQLANQITVETK